ncbi:MAG: helix-turn-helix transcriptional regulator [Eubacteriales bacterium]|nr:helix-turn-helix transcriptional regulator [Eubacteriales bacterium]MDD4421487.1 helix-turn-helix transcriptional regulator [Eubacteriales bacterium]HBR32082.1 hypothetical protein [Clostridiales bacterium]
MDDIKQIIAKNITSLRKSTPLTQAELAEELNYSDKAVSKWERGESIPDISVLKQLADLYGVTLDYLIEEDHTNSDCIKTSVAAQQKKNKKIITLLAISVVWLVATILFVSIGLYAQDVSNLWVIYVYAVPCTFTVLLIFNSIWGNRRKNFLIITLLIWSVLTSIYLSLLSYNIWLIFVIGIPSQIIVALWSRIQFEKH